MVNPVFSATIWSFEGLRPFTGTSFSTTPLGLATVAALTPKHWEVQIADENVEPIDFDIQADLIGITAFNVQYQRSLAIAAEFKKRGKIVVFGGPYCSLFPEAFEGKGDYRISGEAEHLWPEFLSDFEKGTARELYHSDAKVNLEISPLPRYDLIRQDRYNTFCLQTSRGCPFQCEFCDIIVTDGRVPRTKTVEQVLAEVEHCVKHGAHDIVFGDANFIGNIPQARKLLKALVEYSQKNNYPVEFSCELTINVAHHPDLLDLLQAANFYTVFVGIESPRRDSLVETKKLQNTRNSMLEDIEKIHTHNISVCAGMIVGFDSDDRLIFTEQFNYLKELGIPFTTCGTLLALPNTPLLKRLESEGRLLDFEWADLNGHGSADCNFIPKKMTLEELNKGYNWLVRCLYRYDSYADRLVTLLDRFQATAKAKKTKLNLKFIILSLKIVIYYLFTGDGRRYEFFSKTFSRIARQKNASSAKWIEFFRWMALYRAFRKYVEEKFGVPEAMRPDQPPYVSLSGEGVSTLSCTEPFIAAREIHRTKGTGRP
ncbi:MAG: B12-binding domain-containing radical SAM protein [Candidatus Omnitrophica bacterium]|nr:B12-binding domain-containing radical SAM protein [Candidatus Omnitrophota bacterium]